MVVPKLVHEGFDGEESASVESQVSISLYHGMQATGTP